VEHRNAMARSLGGGPAIDPLRLAARGDAVTGESDVRMLPQVADALAPGDAPVPLRWRIAGAADAAGRPALTIELQGALPLVCQRCLAPFAWPLAQTTRVLLARDAAELAALDEAVDDEVLLGSAKVGAQTLVEDELILAMPFAPVHPDACP
jgi:uncharacterized protein